MINHTLYIILRALKIIVVYLVSTTADDDSKFSNLLDEINEVMRYEDFDEEI